MSPRNDRLEPGDAIYHPKYGFGIVQALTRRDRVHPIHEPTLAEANSEHTEDYYNITLREGGALLVPVSRADSVGLRRLSNGIAAITASLRSPAQSLPANARERAAVLRTREQLPEPEALAQTVRDVVAQSHGRALSSSERLWLDKACHRLSAEAALVDNIPLTAAKAAIWQVVTQLTTAS